MKTVTKKIRVALTGGGTGGHVYPLISVVEELQKQAVGEFNLEFHYYGPRDIFSADLERAGVVLHKIMAGKLRRYFSLLNILDVPKVFLGFFVALWKLYWLMPDVLFSKGGTGAFPVVLAAWFYRIPVVIHESDSVPGLTNLLSARFARKIALGFSNAAKYFNPNKIVFTGNPVRGSILKWRMEQGPAKEKLGFDAPHPLIAVVGGSQGAQQINEMLILCLGEILPLASVIHQTGPANYSDVEKLSKAALMDIPVEIEKSSRYKFVPYFDEETSGAVLSAADLIVARAGAGSIAEFSAFGKPALLIPLAGHQTENAYAFSMAGAAQVIESANLTPQVFTALTSALIADPELRTKMALASKNFHHPEASLTLAKEILAVAGFSII